MVEENNIEEQIFNFLEKCLNIFYKNNFLEHSVIIVIQINECALMLRLPNIPEDTFLVCLRIKIFFMKEDAK